MTGKEYKDELYELKFTCGFNHRYHQIVAWRWRNLDRILRITVGLLAVIGLAFSLPSVDAGWFGFTVALISLAVAVVLNILPVGDWEKCHTDFFRQWSDCLRDAEKLYTKTRGLNESEAVTDPRLTQLCDLVERTHLLHASEPAAWNKLLRKCEDDEREAEHGLRTNKEIEKACAVSRAAHAPADEIASGASSKTPAF